MKQYDGWIHFDEENGTMRFNNKPGDFACDVEFFWWLGKHTNLKVSKMNEYYEKWKSERKDNE